MFRTFVNAWKIVDLRKKLLFTALIILIYRVGSALPVPFVDIAMRGDGLFGEEAAGTFLTYLSMMTGNAFNYGTLFALSITPYINASIIIQLLAVAIPYLQNLSKEGEEGRKKMNKITRYSAVGLGLLQSIAYFFFIRSQDMLMSDANGKAFTGFAAVFQAIVVIFCYTAGTALVMWLGELINEKGIGNGISMILFAGIVARMPTTIYNLYQYMDKGGVYFALVPIAAIALVGMIFFIVWMDNAERRIPVQYAKRVVGRKMYGGQSTHIPIKVNMSGVMPVIFAMSILMFPGTVASFFPNSGFAQAITNVFDASGIFYNILYALLIVFFTYFYSAISFNPVDVAENIKKNGGFIPGLRPGRPTSEYISKVMSRITLFGAIFLAAIAVLPAIIMGITGLELYFGGTALLIVVGVALDTMKQLEASLLMRSYEGFMK